MTMVIWVAASLVMKVLNRGDYQLSAPRSGRIPAGRG